VKRKADLVRAIGKLPALSYQLPIKQKPDFRVGTKHLML
jgi:hypothetical protein